MKHAGASLRASQETIRGHDWTHPEPWTDCPCPEAVALRSELIESYGLDDAVLITTTYRAWWDRVGSDA